MLTFIVVCNIAIIILNALAIKDMREARRMMRDMRERQLDRR